MTAYLLVRTPYAEEGACFGELAATDVCSWFRKHWRDSPSEAAPLEAASGLGVFFDKMRDEGVLAPPDNAALVALLNSHLYSERDHLAEEHFVHVETDDDEMDIEYWIFDDELLAAEPDRLPLRASFEPNPEWFEFNGDEDLIGNFDAYDKLIETSGG